MPNMVHDNKKTKLEKIIEETFGTMRNETEEEKDSIKQYIKSISADIEVEKQPHREEAEK